MVFNCAIPQILETMKFESVSVCILFTVILIVSTCICIYRKNGVMWVATSLHFSISDVYYDMFDATLSASRPIFGTTRYYIVYRFPGFLLGNSYAIFHGIMQALHSDWSKD